MLDKMKQLMEVKRQADQIKKQLENMTAEVEAVKGIRITVTGTQNFRSIEIDAGLLKPENKGKLEADLLRSLNAAAEKAQGMAREKMAALMPPGF